MDESAFTYCDPADPFWRRLAIGGVERLTGRETIKRLYLAHRRAGWGAQGDFFAAALASRTPLIVSGDQHLLAVAEWQGIAVLSPRQFVDRHLAPGDS